MARRDKRPTPANQRALRQASPPEQPIEGRLHGSGTELEAIYDGQHDISHVDCQEGNMEHGVTGGFLDEEKEEEEFIPTH